MQSNGVYKLEFLKYLVARTVTLKMFTKRSLNFISPLAEVSLYSKSSLKFGY